MRFYKAGWLIASLALIFVIWGARPLKLNFLPLAGALRGVADDQETTVSVSVVDEESGLGLPCRLTVVDDNGSLAPLKADSKSGLAAARGMIYTASGQGRFRLPRGNYTVFASRGFEYSVAAWRISALAGASIENRLKLRREVPTPGYVGADTHTHTYTYSGQGDASLADRVLTIAGEGIELPVASDHDVVTDYHQMAEEQGVRTYLRP
ncbi:MAG: hypothetical protein ACRD1R_12200 [Acidobacteriota bacterium]